MLTNMQNTGNNYLLNVQKLFHNYQLVGEKAIAQIRDEQINWRFNQESNSIATIVKHIAGNSISRWTDFLTSDGEKPWRDRDDEFEGIITSKDELKEIWDRGWECLYNAIDSLTEDDLLRIVYIRNEGHTVIEAINRSLAHIPYHVGQIVFIAKMLADQNWQTLTTPRRKPASVNNNK